MSAEATAAMASAPEKEMVEIEVASDQPSNDALNNKATGLHSPPDSNSALKLDGSDDSELSDLDDPSFMDMDMDMDMHLHVNPSSPAPPPEPANDDQNVKQEEEEDIGEVIPDHWSGTVPVFKPDMHQFKDFKKFMTKVDCYGMKSGIIKIIPPKEWTDKRPPLDDMIKQIRVREPIKQDIMGSNGTYRQVNILHQRSYNIPQWRQLCDQSEHQPPAKRGERRAQAPSKPKPASSSSATDSKRRRSTRGRGKRGAAKDKVDQEDRPMTPVSPKPNEEIVESVEQDPGAEVDDDDDGPPVVGRMGGARQAKPKLQSTSARRKYSRREASARIDEEAFKDFDYRMDISDYTPDRCEELERIYWKTLTYAQPLYGADLPGTLFDDECDTWNLNKLPNLLDVLGTKVPGVNTAYLYLGMWKATFAWHLEDVDLYSINYLHFGAPKQWYSISQGDARRFEAAMKSIWPTDAKACDQFLRHKAFLISPNHLANFYNIKVNKCVSYPGEFVVTYPYGYHSGYNLGYNCAEAVNFALDSWLPMGKIAKRCECAQAQDSVWVDVYEIERKLRGEETDYEETEDEEDEDEDEDDDDLDNGVPTPPSSNAVRFKQPGRKRKRPAADKGERQKAKKIRLRVKNHVEPPCCLCPHDIPGQEVLPTSDGRKAHRICALYGPETWVETVEGKEVVANIENVSKARLELKCLYCRSKRGACFQCSQKKCARSYHATCAAAAGVLVEEADVPIFGEDGTEYKEQTFEFSCRFHRTKRDKKLDGDGLEECQKTRQAATTLKKGDICQLQYYRGDIFAGVVVENRADEQTLLVDIIPNGERVEVEWKWLLLPDPADFHLPKASANAIPMPTSRKAKDQINATKRVTEELPRADAPFVEGFTWAEFNSCDCSNKFQAKVDLSKDNQIWYYLGRTSTEARAQYTEDPKKPRHNPKSNFLETVPRPAPPTAQPRKSYGSTFSVQTPTTTGAKPDKPYQYKPRDPVIPSYVHSSFTTQQFVPKPPPFTAQQYIPRPPFYPPQGTAPRLVPAPEQTLQRTPQQSIPKPAPTPPIMQQKGPYTPQQNIQKPVYTPQFINHYPPQQSIRQQTSTDQQSRQFIPQQTTQKLVSTPQHSRQPPAQHVISRPAPVPRPTPPQGGHTRSRSSLNGQSLAFGSDHRFRTPPFSYGGGRIDSTAKSPFSHGFSQPPGLGPSPSPQNGQLFQAQARARSGSLASNRSFDTPMTSSAIRPSSASAQGTMGEAKIPPQYNAPKQARPSIVQRYAFFQVHHNRDSTKYRTPYANWGGFTNGYEGNLRAHLMRSPEALFEIRRRSSGFSSGTPGPPPTRQISFSNGIPNNGTPSPAPYAGNSGSARPSAGLPTSDSPTPLATQKVTLPTTHIASTGRLEVQQTPARVVDSSYLNEGPITQLHPAIRARYAALLQTRTFEARNEQTTVQAHQAMLNQQSPSTPLLSSQVTSVPSPMIISAPNPNSSQSKVDTPPPSNMATMGQKQPSSTNSNALARTPSLPPRQTYIPPPRPWETLRKSQVPVQPQYFPTEHPSRSVTPTIATPTITPNAPGPFMYNGSGNPRHIESPGPQPSNPQPDESRAVSVRDVRPADIQRLSTTTAIQQPSATESVSSPGRYTTTPIASAPVPSIAVDTSDLPEVPDDSMELIESIIRDARRISSTHCNTANENIEITVPRK
ncbi:hypothetical protein F4815DRAFT_474556 [Daldinia loculata]|nr:hypothetical protein F4815DRAFT_474556 [Daldinia loculata]